MEVLGYFSAVCIGLILGLLGGGGSILSIPILVYLFQMDAVLASAYSLFIVGITSFVGAIPKYRDHLVNIRTGVIFGIPSIIAIFSTRKWVIPAIPDILYQGDTFILTKRILLLGIFALLMIFASFSMIRGRRERVAKDRKGIRFFLVILEGTLIGFLTGLVGAGGGFLIIPALMFLTGLSFKTAVGTSLFIIAVNSLVGFLGDVMNYAMDWTFLFAISGLAVIGILIGNALQKNISSIHLRKSFGWLVLLMGTWILVKELLIR